MKSYGLRLRLGIGVAALTMAAAPAFAADLAYPAAPPPAGSPLYSPASVVTGDFTLGIGWTGVDGNLDDDSTTGLIGGRTNIPLWSGWNEEIEVAGVKEFDNSAFTAGIFGHTYYKTQGWAAGFVIGGGATDPFQSASSNGFATLGFEGIVFLPSSSFIGQADYNFSDGGDFWTLSLEGRYYFEPNTKLTGLFAWSAGSANDAWLIGSTLEHRWAGTRFSNFITADWAPIDGGPDKVGLLVGFRYLFDQPSGTLQSHDYEIPFNRVHATVF
jgi:hypothetical protein